MPVGMCGAGGPGADRAVRRFSEASTRLSAFLRAVLLGLCRACGCRGLVSRARSPWRSVLPWLVILAALPPVSEAAAAPTEIGQVRLRHGPVHFELVAPRGHRPDECPLVVLVAGYAVPMVVWDATVQALVDQGFSVLRFDFYGRGRSARPRVKYDGGLFAEQIWDLVTEPRLKLPRRFHIVASSMGGAIAAVFANRHPDALDRVVLVSPAGLSVQFPPITTLLKTPGLGKWYFAWRFREIMLEHLRDNLYGDVRLYPKMLAEYRRQLEVPGSADALYSTLRLTVLQDMTEEFRGLGGLRRPTQVIWGSEDHLVPLKDTRRALERAIPHLELRTIRGAAHLPQLEQSDTFNARVTEFLLRR